ncbi:unnamed protein product [Darwinula stevensoni]|uniref:Protein kinase domain-containing protein n=1 Tax=Darwinula stevensoni TaxID=69355 RepID=A0A7R8XA53_9CRUS|nr:unnamed protein product [Darwinula stevensoni]CAG0885018.1 unnamed protein product [Darwinula stevensoni]
MNSLEEELTADEKEELAEAAILAGRGYKIGSLLGKGAFGEVRTASYRRYDGRVEKLACKVIDVKKLKEDFMEKFFPRELEIVRWIDHPHVVVTHSILSRRSKVYVFMEYASNGTLLAYVKKTSNIPERRVQRWFRQLASGVHYLHGHGWAHRDLKCENVLLTESNDVKIADFGFARPVRSYTGKKEKSATYCGSRAYCAPEILRGRPYDPLVSDVWSLGVILYVMMCQLMPFRNKNPKKLLREQESRTWKFPDRVLAAFSQPARALVLSILEPVPAKRMKLNAIVDQEWMKGRDSSDDDSVR